MPYISTKFSGSLSEQTREKIKEKYGEAIALVPGKSEAWLMLSFQDEAAMYFRGESGRPLCFVEVQLYGRAADSEYAALTEAITDILAQETGTDPGDIYITYREVDHWGCGGRNL